MIVLSGQANSFHLSDNNLRTKGIQEVKTEEIVKSIVKRVYTIRNPTAAIQIIEDAIFFAKNGRPGPVWIDIPLDIQNKIIDEDVPDHYIMPKYNSLENYYVVEKLLSAKQPIILVGNGVRLDTSQGYLYDILNSFLHIPILTTWRSMDLFEENHPLYVGRPGMIGQRGANWIMQNCDYLLCLGARLDLPSVAFDYKNFAPKAMKFIVDIDQAELGKLCCTDESWLGLNYNVYDFLKQLHLYLLRNNLLYNNLEWLAHCKKLHNQPIETIKSNKLSLYQFIEQLTPYLENKTVVVGSSGTISEVFCQSFKVPKGCRVIQSNGLGSMGFGLPAAIGAHYASGKPIVMLDGDGSFALNTQELALVSGANLPITMIIINNGGYVSIKNTQNSICEGRQLGVDSKHGLYLPNYELMARSYNLPYYQLRYEDAVHYIQYAIDMAYPCIVEVFTDPDHKTQCRTTSTKQPDGTIKASGLENLWP
jgi:acetolactate synthase-1/2/3 large subunit